MAGNPNRAKTLKLAALPNKATLNKLLAKCTIAVMAMAISNEKNNATTGINKVPKPKPENKVNPEAIRATNEMIKYSI